MGMQPPKHLTHLLENPRGPLSEAKTKWQDSVWVWDGDETGGSWSLSWTAKNKGQSAIDRKWALIKSGKLAVLGTRAKGPTSPPTKDDWARFHKG